MLDGLNSELPSGWEWLNARVQPREVEVVFGPPGLEGVSCEQAPLCIRLVSARQLEEGDVQGGEFAVRVVGHEVGQEGVAQRMAERMGEELWGWQEEPDVAPVWEERGWSGDLQLWVIWLAFLLLGAGLVSLFLAELRRIRWRYLALGLGGIALFFSASWFLAPHGVFHDNNHGYAFLTKVQSDSYPDHTIASSYLALAQLVEGLAEGGESLFFGLNTLLMALSAVLVGWWAGIASGRVWAGVTAAALWGLGPLALRLGPTDSLFTLSLGLLFGASLLLALGIRRVGEGRWVAGVIATLGAVAAAVVCGQSHVATMFLPPVVLPLALALVAAWRTEPGRGATGGLAAQRRATWLSLGGVQWAVVGAATLLVVIGLVPAALSIFDAAMAREGNRFIELGNVVSLRSWGLRVWWDSNWTSALLVPFGVLGLAWLAISGRVAVLGWSLAALLLLLISSLTIATCRHLHLVMELPLVALATAFATFGALWAPEVVGRGSCWLSTAVWRLGLPGCSGRWLERASRALFRQGGSTWPGWAVRAALLWGLFWTSPWERVSFETPGTTEYAFLTQEVIPALSGMEPSALFVANGVRSPETERMPLPAQWLRLRSGWQRVTGDLAEYGEGAGPDFVYVGLACVPSIAEAEALRARGLRPGPLSAHCQGQLDEVLKGGDERGARLEPVVERVIEREEPGFLCIGYPEEEMRVGLYRVVRGAR